jgi:hypothetical protein
MQNIVVATRHIRKTIAATYTHFMKTKQSKKMLVPEGRKGLAGVFGLFGHKVSQL